MICLSLPLIIVLFLRATHTSATVLASNVTTSAQSSSIHHGFGYELIQSKLDSMEYRFSQFFAEMKHQIVRPDNDVMLSQLYDLHYCSKSSTRRLSELCMKNWLMVLQRSDGSENFNRNWTDYREGFGTVEQEFWLGLERLHELTKSDSYEMLVELEDFAGNYRYARYDKFSVGAGADLYPLTELGAYSGTAGDSFRYHKGYKFSALDKGPKTDCVRRRTGGWWYHECFEVHLTGTWERKNDWSSVTWESFASIPNTALKFVRMMIRKQ